MIRGTLKTLEKAEIMEDRIQYADYVLDYDKTKELSQKLTSLLNAEETSDNYAELITFVKESELVIHAFDVEALNINSIQQGQ